MTGKNAPGFIRSGDKKNTAGELVEASTIKENNKILIALSGGVKSAVAASLMRKQGEDLVGVYFDLSEIVQKTAVEIPCLQNHWEYVVRLGKYLDIPVKKVNVAEMFESHVIDPFVHRAIMGQDPEGCYRCHKMVKFQVLKETARLMAIRRIATGHAAQVFLDLDSGGVRLSMALDLTGDQSFFLSGLDPEDLQHLVLPVGGLSRDMVDRLVMELPEGSYTAEEGQNQCFSERQPLVPWVERRTAQSVRPRGSIKDYEGHVRGDQEGLHHYWVGQADVEYYGKRKDDALMVVGLDPMHHVVLLGPVELLQAKEAMVVQVEWIRKPRPLHELRCQAKFSSTMEQIFCTLTPFSIQSVHVQFESVPEPLIIGKRMVFYEEAEVIGAGWVERVGKDLLEYDESDVKRISKSGTSDAAEGAKPDAADGASGAGSEGHPGEPGKGADHDPGM